jgi:mRNA-degrading endonuclease RelE of RelBE toxin-antitoxin system
MTWSIQFTPPAVKDIKRLKENAGKMLKAIGQLAADPNKGHTLEGTLKGVRSLEHNPPGGAYRAAYVLSTQDKVCLVFVVGPHEGFYDKATRRVSALRRAGTIP